MKFQPYRGFAMCSPLNEIVRHCLTNLKIRASVGDVLYTLYLRIKELSFCD